MQDQRKKEKHSNIKIISLKAEHLKECLELDHIAFNGLWTEQQWQKELSEKKRLCLGVFQKKRLVAYASGWIVIDELQITSIAVHPKYQRIGIGERILSALLTEAQKGGLKKATLEVDSNNLPAIKIYTKLGFKSNGLRANYYKNGNDALILWLPLGQA